MGGRRVSSWGLDGAPRDPDWVEQAACRGEDPKLFFPQLGENGVEAKKICHRCPVRVECLEAALSLGVKDQYGVWGGMSERERLAVLRGRRRAS